MLRDQSCSETVPGTPWRGGASRRYAQLAVIALLLRTLEPIVIGQWNRQTLLDLGRHFADFIQKQGAHSGGGNVVLSNEDDSRATLRRRITIVVRRLTGECGAIHGYERLPTIPVEW